MSYMHIDIDSAVCSKKIGQPCGDVFDYFRTEQATTLIICDGLGSGIKANINANFCCSRIKKLLSNGISMRKTFEKIVRTMESIKGKEGPYSVFTLLRICKDGNATVLNYEMPRAILVTEKYATELKREQFLIDGFPVYESHYKIKAGQGILALSDGITEAGLGEQFVKGWGVSGVVKHLNHCINSGVSRKNLSKNILSRSVEICGTGTNDDCSVILAGCRNGNILNILTGPPLKRSYDKKIIREFIEREGEKVICGGQTAVIFSRESAKEITYAKAQHGDLAPPCSFMEGIELVTDGALTLNQVYRLLDEDIEALDMRSAVSQMCYLLREADFITFTLGQADNDAHHDISFRQRGLLPRVQVVKKLAENLKKQGKLVLIKKA